MSTVYFSDILSINSPEKSYEEIQDIEKINMVVSTFLNNYNTSS